MGYILRHGRLIRDILEGEVGKSRGRRRPRLKYFDQIIRDMGCETFREVKQRAGDRAETGLRTVYSMMMMMDHSIKMLNFTSLNEPNSQKDL